MKRLLVAVLLLGVTGTAWGQASSVTQQPAGGSSSRVYIGAVGGVTLGHVTASTYGGEFGYKWIAFELFAEGGRMTDVTSSATADAAAAIGNYLGTLGLGEASWTVSSPANYGAVGARYLFLAGAIVPYVAVSMGVANLEHDTAYSLNGSDVTESLPSLGVQLGDDLDGTTNNLLLTAGGGLRISLGPLQLDVGARYGRIFSDPGTDTFRVYAGAGFRF